MEVGRADGFIVSATKTGNGTWAASFDLPKGGDLVLRNAGTSPVPLKVYLNGWTSAAATEGGSRTTMLAAPAR